MDFSWKVIIDIGAIAIALLAATVIRSRVRFFQRYLIPNALTAGFLLLPVYNWVLPALGYGTNRLGELVYHLLNVSFIAMTLRAAPSKPAPQEKGSVLGTTGGILLGYSAQALLGLALTLLFLPAVFPAFGLFLPLGFALGPGQAYAIGKGWEGMGFAGASSIGLSFAAIGYLWACFGGVFLVNHGIRNGWLHADLQGILADKSLRAGVVPRGEPLPLGASLTTDNEAIDSFSLHIAAVAATYFLSYLLLLGISWLLGFAGKPGEQLASNLWGVNFIFSSLTGLVVRRVVNLFKVDHVLDDHTLARISGFSVDFMIAGSLAAISLVFVGAYWFPILLMSTVCGVMTLVITPWVSSRMFRTERFERMILLYGVSTGTLSTGLALLRMLDPEFKTRVASDYMLSSGLTFALAIPFILAINLPAQATPGGNMTPYWLMMAISGAYLLFVIAVYLIVAKKRAFAKPGKLWFPD